MPAGPQFMQLADIAKGSLLAKVVLLVLLQRPRVQKTDQQVAAILRNQR